MQLNHNDLVDIIEHANDLIQSVAPDGTILYVNKAWKKTLGYSDEDLEQIKFFDIIADSCKEKCSLIFGQVLQGLKLDHVETAFKAKDGRIVYVEGSCNCRFENGKPVSTRGIFRDITDRKKAELKEKCMQKRLERAKLFESLVIMAGGIAHDYNNILMAILGFTELIRMKASSKKDVLRLADQLEDSALRATELTKQMLAFSGSANGTLENQDLSSFVKNMETSINKLIPNNINLVLDLSESLPTINLDTRHMRQAIRDVIKNSVEAIESSDSPKGTITIETGTITFDGTEQEEAFLMEKPHPGQYCYISLKDDGPGIAEQDIQRVFEPFYTTKFHGRGLGLSATLGIVKGHGGVIKLESEPGKGTTLTMYLPVSEPSDSKLEESSTQNRLSINSPNMIQGKILVIDKEPSHNPLAKELENRGFEIEKLTDEKKISEFIKTCHNSFDMAILRAESFEKSTRKILKHLNSLNQSMPVIMIEDQTETVLPEAVSSALPSHFNNGSR